MTGPTCRSANRRPIRSTVPASTGSRSPRIRISRGSPSSRLDFVDRDVPPDVRIYQKKDGRLVEYTRGIDPQSLQRERPPRPGANKFTTRVIGRGTYFVRVDACQPDYQLRTKLFDVPPYLKPEEAARPGPRRSPRPRGRPSARRWTSSSWPAIAGTPTRPARGIRLDRVANFHHETSTCIACHATHFTTQSVLAGVKSGYDVEQPFALQFLTERLANNPVPFHGHDEALWARMIPAPANVLGRLSTMVMDYEDRIAGAHRDNLHRGIAEFLELYYDGRTELPPDETNGNNPVSRYKVATDSWRQLDEIAPRTGDPRYGRDPRPRRAAPPHGETGQHPRPGRADDRPLPARPETGEARRTDRRERPMAAVTPAAQWPLVGQVRPELPDHRDADRREPLRPGSRRPEAR